MSLTNPFGIKERKIKGIIKECCPDKNDFYSSDGTECFDTKAECIISSKLTTTESNLCGTAFDYLARFLIAKKILKNKDNAIKSLCAEGVFNTYGFYHIDFDVDSLKKIGIIVKRENICICGGCNFYLQKELNLDRERIDKLLNKGFVKISRLDEEKISLLRQDYLSFLDEIKDFIFNLNDNEEELIKKCIILAQLEQINRSSIGAKTVSKLFDFCEEHIPVKDELHSLFDSFKRTFLPIVKFESEVIFNPRFGIGSRIIGGADADVFIDGVLYDFKVIKKNGWSSPYATQIIGYYLLDLFAKKCEDWKSDLYNKKIDKVALYNARYEKIYYFDCDKLTKTVIGDVIHKISDTYILYKVFYLIRHYDSIIEKYNIPIEGNNCFDWNEDRAAELENYIKKKEEGIVLSEYEGEEYEKLYKISRRISDYLETVDSLLIIRDIIKE
ncbi:MAG: hypothetical protein IKU15_08215, partial [Clostridia bacterium]|nr:hypothetical protein [Clostridia bacterium]